MSFVVVIPARYASTRLPGKPLIDLAGKSMVQRVYDQATASGAQQVIVATDDQRIESSVKGWGGQVLMTSAGHQSGTDRLAEVARSLDLQPDEVVVNLQGDEPLMPADVIRQVADNLEKNPDCHAATLCEPIVSKVDFLNPSVVKVVIDNHSRAIYFSRAPIPWPRDIDLATDQLPEGLGACRHLGIYAYRSALLQEFVGWPATHLEKTEMLEQLRILSNGRKIHVAISVQPVPAGVDTQHDVERVRELLQA